jgi:predicted acetyltransferase
MGEFFIIAKFQGKNIGRQVAWQIFDKYSGIWEVSVIPENRSGLSFWEGVISTYTHSNFNREIKIIDFDKHQPQRIIFTFDTDATNTVNTQKNIIV